MPLAPLNTQVSATALAIAGSVFLLLSVGTATVFGLSTDINALDNFSRDDLQPLLGGYWGPIVLSWLIRGGYLLCILATLLLYMHPLRSCLAEMMWPDATGACEDDLQSSDVPAAAGDAAADNALAATDAGVAPTTGTAGSAGNGNTSTGVAMSHATVEAAAAAGTGGDKVHGCCNGQEQQHTEDKQLTSMKLQRAAGSHQQWQQLEQANYYPLTYGLLAAMVLTAVLVTDIYEAVSAVGDLASTVQAFVVPGGWLGRPVGCLAGYVVLHTCKGCTSAAL